MFQRVSYRFEITQGGVNDYRISILGYSSHKKKINTVMGHHMMSNIKIRILKQTNLTDLADFNGFIPQGLFCNHWRQRRALQVSCIDLIQCPHPVSLALIMRTWHPVAKSSACPFFNRVWLQTCTCTLRLALSDTCASASDVTCSLFYFVVFIDYVLFESLNILQ